MTYEMPQSASIEHAIAVLRESAKQHRLSGDHGHGRACDSAGDVLERLLTADDREEARRYFAALMTRPLVVTG